MSLRPKRGTVNCWQCDIRSVSLERVLAWALTTAKTDRLLFTMRLSEGQAKKRSAPADVEKNVEKIFGDRLIDSFWASGWPGTELIGHKGRVWVAKFDETVLALILATQPDFSLWHNNASLPLPEDLCLFKQGSRYPTLVSATHEKDVWLFGPTKPAFTELRKEPSLLRGFIFSGKYFCKL